MITMSQILGKQITSLTEHDLEGAVNIGKGVFYKAALTSVALPDSVIHIGENAFYACKIVDLKLPSHIKSIGNSAFTSLQMKTLKVPGTLESLGSLQGDLYTYVDTSELSPECSIDVNSFGMASPWFKSLGVPQVIANGKILLGFRGTTDWSESIPKTVVTLAQASLQYGWVGSTSYYLESFVIPDHIRYIQSDVFSYQEKIAKIVIGSNVSKMSSHLVPDTNPTAPINTLVFRQPSDLVVDLPTPGEDTGLAYAKSSRSVTIYTDNESIKNYNWSGDNITATFKPLSEAPTITTAVAPASSS